MKEILPEEHQKLIHYIEREKRKNVNKAKKLKMQMLLGTISQPNDLKSQKKNKQKLDDSEAEQSSDDEYND